jgi:hypothetical protein
VLSTQEKGAWTKWGDFVSVCGKTKTVLAVTYNGDNQQVTFDETIHATEEQQDAVSEDND